MSIGSTASASVEITAVGRSKTRRHSHQFTASASTPLASGTSRSAAIEGCQQACTSKSGAKKKGLRRLPVGV